MSKVIALKPLTSIARMVCESCGASANASCNCGVAYVPAGQRASDAIARNPSKSDRAIAAELGVSDKTVAKARKSTAEKSAVRLGKDGKVRKLPRRPQPLIAEPVKEINLFHRELVGFLDDFTRRFDKWHASEPPIDKNGKAALMQAFYLCADGFAQLAQKLDGR